MSSDYAATKLEVFGDVAHPTHFPHVPDFGSMMKWNENYIHLTHKRINQAVSNKSDGAQPDEERRGGAARAGGARGPSINRADVEITGCLVVLTD